MFGDIEFQFRRQAQIVQKRGGRRGRRLIAENPGQRVQKRAEFLAERNRPVADPGMNPQLGRGAGILFFMGNPDFWRCLLQGRAEFGKVPACIMTRFHQAQLNVLVQQTVK